MPPKLANLKLHEHGIQVPYNLPGLSSERLLLDIYVDDSGDARKEYVLCDLCNYPTAIMGRHKRSTAGLDSHRDKKECKRRVEKGPANALQRRINVDAHAEVARQFHNSAGQGTLKAKTLRRMSYTND